MTEMADSNHTRPARDRPGGASWGERRSRMPAGSRRAKSPSRARPSFARGVDAMSVPVNPSGNENSERCRQVSLAHSVSSAHLNRALGV